MLLPLPPTVSPNPIAGSATTTEYSANSWPLMALRYFATPYRIRIVVLRVCEQAGFTSGARLNLAQARIYLQSNELMLLLLPRFAYSAHYTGRLREGRNTLVESTWLFAEPYSTCPYNATQYDVHTVVPRRRE